MGKHMVATLAGNRFHARHFSAAASAVASCRHLSPQPGMPHVPHRLLQLAVAAEPLRVISFSVRNCAARNGDDAWPETHRPFP
jgi:hypothetical protein